MKRIISIIVVALLLPAAFASRGAAFNHGTGMKISTHGIKALYETAKSEPALAVALDQASGGR